MRGRGLYELFKIFFDQFEDKENPRADMYLPLHLLIFGILSIVMGIVMFIVEKNSGDVATSIFLFVTFEVVGVCAIISWKNQKIVVLSNDEFEYTTFLGKKRRYYFSEIQGMRQNPDSKTLIVRGQKVHIEKIAVLSERFTTLVNEALERTI